MTSTLYVDNLVEKTSGNGVHVPGHVVQVQSVRGDFPGDISTSSSSYVEVHSTLRNTFTPKYSNSIIHIEYFTSSYGWSTDYIYFQLRGDGSALESTNDYFRNKSQASVEMSATIYLEVPSWGTTSKIISPYYKSNGAATVFANWSGSSPIQYVKVTEIAQ